MSLATLSRQDCISDESLFPWIGFVYTSPAYRGHRYAGRLLSHGEAVAAGQGHGNVYLTTDHVGLYEKYGYEYLESRLDRWGNAQRVMRKTLKGAEMK